MRWRGVMCLMVGVASGVLTGCFEVPPLPEAPECVADADCRDDVFCNGVERCVASACVAGTRCDDVCVELGEGEGVCGGEPGPEPRPEPAPEPAPEAAPEPGPEPTAEPTPDPTEPEPEPQCLEDGGKCRLINDAVGTCAGGECVAIGCADPSTCPAPGCATCERGICGLLQGCASVELVCMGPLGNRAQVICGDNTRFIECSAAGSRLGVGCRAGARAQVCCGAVDDRCGDISVVPARAQLRISPAEGWQCPAPGAGSATCEHPELLQRTETSVNCMVELALPGKR